MVATSDSLGNKLDTYTYSPYGESGAEGDGGFPFRFTGQKLEATTGLYYYKARWYDPEVGRFLQPDPIGYADGMNMYAYAGGDPVNGTDPSGLRCVGSASVSDTVVPIVSGGPVLDSCGGWNNPWEENDAYDDLFDDYGGGGGSAESGAAEKKKKKKCNQRGVNLGNDTRQFAHELGKVGGTVSLTGVALVAIGAPEAGPSGGGTLSPGGVTLLLGSGTLLASGVIDITGGVVQGLNGAGFDNAKGSIGNIVFGTAFGGTLTFLPPPVRIVGGGILDGLAVAAIEPAPLKCPQE